MAKVGRFVSDPAAGSYCQVTLDSGEKIVISHDKGGFKGGRLTVEASKLFGLRATRIFDLDLDSLEGRAVVAELTRHAQPHSTDATPLGAFAAHLQSCASVEEVKAKCQAIARSSAAGQRSGEERSGDRRA